MEPGQASHAARAKERFLEAVELPPAERGAYLEHLRAAEPSLAGRVEGLLAGHARAAEAAPATALARAALDETVPERIGDYRLLDRLGEGGFGTVWRAEQAAPVRRQVALKLLKAGLDTREVVARFQAERQALALMDHPCIAKVFDGGSTPEGRPWFAMELVLGRPITELCEARGLAVEARLGLFLEVCRAVQHAHQKGVIHRDLKPSNVLVAEVDGRLAPKVIDFGIAKALEQPLVEQPFATRGGQLVGTPAYMSPEQAAGSADVDTRSDVYSLGVLLYEILCGGTPFDAASGGAAELRRQILEADPPRPSTRLAAARGRTTALARRVRGDLDWIVMRCLEKDRDRRYASASQLALDVQRHLDGEPVSAGPPGVLYRAGKFARRHRAALVGLCAVFLALVGGTVVSTVQAARARRAERAAALEAGRARVELGRYEAVASFLRDVLLSIDPAVAQERDTELLREVLEQAALRVGATQEPEVEATLRHAIGYAFFSLALLPAAERELARALALRRAELGPEHQDTLTAENDLGSLWLQQRRLAEAAPLVEHAHAGRRAALGPEDERTLQSLGVLAQLRREEGRLEEAEALARELERVRRELLGERDPSTIRAMNNLALTLDARGQRFEALALYERALALNEETSGPTNPVTLSAMGNLANAYMEAGRLDEALDLMLEALARKERIYARDHPSVILALNNLGQLQRDLGRLEDADALYGDALERSLVRHGERHRQTAILRFNRGIARLALGRAPEAEADLARALETILALGGEPELERQLQAGLAEARARAESGAAR